MIRNGAAEAVEGSNEKIPMPSGLVELSFRFREIPRFACLLCLRQTGAGRFGMTE